MKNNRLVHMMSGRGAYLPWNSFFITLMLFIIKNSNKKSASGKNKLSVHVFRHQQGINTQVSQLTPALAQEHTCSQTKTCTPTHFPHTTAFLSGLQHIKAKQNPETCSIFLYEMFGMCLAMLICCLVPVRHVSCEVSIAWGLC